MRLLSTRKVNVVEVHGVDIPSYAILSHTWSDEEILLQDLHVPGAYDLPWSEIAKEPSKLTTVGGIKKKGLEKILKSTALALQRGYEYIWIDTCCIDKTSSAELSEAINSMYKWYNEADICYAYLADASPAGIEDPSTPNSTFRQSRWFTRGWTLQELIASRQVEFFARDWTYLGAKNGDISFTKLLNEITGIQLEVLTGEMSPQDVSIGSRMHWAADRQTTRVEDIAYCLLGIFNVNIPLLYGEGKRSFIRLQEAILSREEDQSLFAWHSESLTLDEADTSWHINNWSSSFCGLLADAPDKFWDDSDIETTMPLTLTGSPPTVTSKGLGVDFLLLPCEDDQVAKDADFRVVLNCERIRDGQRESPVIYLKRLRGMGDQFARVRSDLKTFVPPNISLLEGGTDERVFVKQNPSSDIRIIRVLSAKNSPQFQLPKDLADRQLQSNWKIKDAWPKQGWTEKTETFLTPNLTFGLPCGLFRLELDADGHSNTVDVAVGMHAPSQRLCRSWCQIMNRDSFLDPQSAFSWAMREAESGNITYSELSTQDIHGGDMSTWAVVTERNRRKGVDITLHVLSQTPQIKTEENHREGFGQIIPLSTLTEEELQKHQWKNPSGPHGFHQTSHAEEVWNNQKTEAAVLMAELAVVDSIEISVFPRVPFGSKVRIGSRRGGPASLGSIKDYCMTSLPAGDTETRSTVQVLFGSNGGNNSSNTEARSYLDACRILEGRADSFLQLRPIHWAVIGGNVAIMRSLLKAGVDAIGKSDRRLTTLHLAMLSDTADILNSLFEFLYPSGSENYDPGGAMTLALGHLEATINNEDYPLHFAASYATTPDFWNVFNFEILSGQLTNRLGEGPLHRASAMGNVTAIKSLVSLYRRAYQIFDVEIMAQVDNHGRTALWHAACSDFTGAVTKQLLLSGAQANFSDLDGLAPIHVSCRQGTVGCLRKLKASGANLDLPAGSLGLLPAHFAAVFGHSRCIRLLLKGNARILTDGAGGLVLNALHLAIANGRESCARAIWDSLDPKPEYRGWSPCIVAEPSGSVLKWMHVEANDQYWFAIEDPMKDGGTKDFMCLSKDEDSPKLWVDPRPSIFPQDDSYEEDNEPEDEVEDVQSEEQTESNRLDFLGVDHPNSPFQGSATNSDDGCQKKEARGLRKASRAIKSLFK